MTSSPVRAVRGTIIIKFCCVKMSEFKKPARTELYRVKKRKSKHRHSHKSKKSKVTLQETSDDEEQWVEKSANELKRDDWMTIPMASSSGVCEVKSSEVSTINCCFCLFLLFFIWVFFSFFFFVISYLTYSN